MKKSSTILLGVTILLAAIVSGCGSKNASSGGTAPGNEAAATTPETGAPNSAEPVTITFNTNYNPDNFKALKKAVEEKLGNIKLEFAFANNASSAQLINTQLAAGEGPDLVLSGVDIVKSGYLVELTDKLFVAQLTDSAKREATLDGKVWYVPLETWFEGILYNKKIFAEQGIEVPQTWNQFIAAAEKLKTAGIKPISIGDKNGDVLGKQSLGVVLSDAYAKNPNIEADVEAKKTTYTEQWLNGLKQWSQILEKGIISKDVLGISYEEQISEFISGKAAMTESGTWEIANIRQKNPELDFGIFPIPSVEGGKPWLVGGTGSAMGVNKNSKHQEEAMKVLEYLVSPEGNALFIAATKGGPSAKGVEGGLDEALTGALEAVNEGRMYAPWQGLKKVGGENFVRTWFKLNQDFVASGKQVEDILGQLDQFMQKELNK